MHVDKCQTNSKLDKIAAQFAKEVQVKLVTSQILQTIHNGKGVGASN